MTTAYPRNSDQPRQTVREIREQAKTISKSYGEGGRSRCGKNKILRVVGDGSVVAGNVRVKSIKRSFMRQSHPDCYSREKDLANRFNRAVIEVLKIQDKDYYAEMKIRDLLKLKSGYARINNIITLKLTMALINWLGGRLSLGSEKIAEITRQVDATHANASGFDVDICDPNIVGEVKGNVPVNGGNRFGADQLKGLTNDVFGMLGLPSLGSGESLRKKYAGRIAQKLISF